MFMNTIKFMSPCDFLKSEVSATGTNPIRLAVLSPYENKPIATAYRYSKNTKRVQNDFAHNYHIWYTF